VEDRANSCFSILEITDNSTLYFTYAQKIIGGELFQQSYGGYSENFPDNSGMI
jgi:hypothetical protein